MSHKHKNGESVEGRSKKRCNIMMKTKVDIIKHCERGDQMMSHVLLEYTVQMLGECKE
jgi:hypothetical protein